MKYIRSRVQNRETVYGVWCSLASSICGEIVAGDILCAGEGGFTAPLSFPKDA